MKKLIALGFAGVSMALIAGCGGDPAPPKTPEQKLVQRRTQLGIGASQQRNADERDRQDKKDQVDEENAPKKDPTPPTPPPPPTPTPPQP